MQLSYRRLIACVFILSTCMDAWSQEADRPNVLFVLTDDQSCSSLSCSGGTLVKTPNIDSLADQGMRFTDAYVMPQCTPPR